MTFLGYISHCLNIFRTRGSREQLFLGIPYPAPKSAEPRLPWREAEEHWTFLPEFLQWGIGYSFDSMTGHCENKTSAPWCCSIFGKCVFEDKSHAWNTWCVPNPRKGHKMLLEGRASAFGFCPRTSKLSEFCWLKLLPGSWRNDTLAHFCSLQTSPTHLSCPAWASCKKPECLGVFCFSAEPHPGCLNGALKEEA